ncbi:MAG: CsbD family protein [Pseudonocardiaceae bacterium]
MALQDKIANAAKVLKGKTKEATGKATGNPRLKLEGKMDKGIGRLKQAGEKVKDSGRRIFGT